MPMCDWSSDVCSFRSHSPHSSQRDPVGTRVRLGHCSVQDLPTVPPRQSHHCARPSCFSSPCLLSPFHSLLQSYWRPYCSSNMDTPASTFKTLCPDMCAIALSSPLVKCHYTLNPPSLPLALPIPTSVLSVFFPRMCLHKGGDLVCPTHCCDSSP